MQPQRLSILGVGLLGGSLGLAAKAQLTGCRVVGYAHRAETLRAALDRGAIDEGYGDVAKAVQGADLVVLCTPVGNLSEILTAIAPALGDRAIVTDVGSTKATVVRSAEREHPRLRFVGSHPMAGSEKRGVQHATADLYKGAVCITTPTEKTDPTALEQVEAFWRLLGMRIRRLNPEAHDARICDVSHLPHAVAAAMVTLQHEAALDLAGRGFMDATRIAGGDGGLWRDILQDNRLNLIDSIGRLRATLDELQSLLEPDRGEELKAWLDRAAARRRAMQAARDAATRTET
ncbi:MAG TPA: prephenate dehydrogenase [Humisphaera sp.]